MGAMQKALPRVADFAIPVVRSPAATPSSSIIVASACAKAPFSCCSQLVNGAVVHWTSEVHPLAGVGGFWKPPDGFLQKPQKMFDFPFPLPVEKEVRSDVPVVGATPISNGPTSAPTWGGGQSWLVGPAEPRFELAGVHGAPSFGPPLHLRVTGSQIGHDWMPESLAHVPPGH